MLKSFNLLFLLTLLLMGPLFSCSKSKQGGSGGGESSNSEGNTQASDSNESEDTNPDVAPNSPPEDLTPGAPDPKEADERDALTHEEMMELLDAQFPKIKVDSLQASNEAKNQSLKSGCETGLSRDQEQKINDKLSASYQEFFAGSLSAQSLEDQIKDILENEGGNLSQEDKVAFEKAQALQILGAFKARLLTSRLAGEVVSDSDLRILKKLGVPRENFERQLQMEASKLQESFELLKSVGFIYTSKLGWQVGNKHVALEGENINSIKTAMSLFFGPAIGRLSFDERRRYAMGVGEFVLILPRINNATKQKYVLVMNQKFYADAVKDLLNEFNKDAKIFAEAAQERGTYKNLMTGAFRKERGLDGKTAPEIAADESDKRMAKAIHRLRNEFGVSKELMDQLIKIRMSLGQLDSEAIDKGLEKLRAAKAFAMAAPLLPVALYLAPIAGAAAAGTGSAAMFFGSGTATLVGTAAAGQMAVISMATMPAIFALASSLGRSAIDASVAHKPFWCSLKDELMVSGLDSLTMGSKLAFIPLGGNLVAAAGTSLGGSAQIGLKSKAVFDTAVALYFLKVGASAAHGGFKNCYNIVRDSDRLAENAPHETELLAALAAESYKTCLQAGVDLGFAITGAVKMGASARKAWLESRPKLEPQDIRANPITNEANMIAAERNTPKEKIAALNEGLFQSLELEKFAEPIPGKKAGMTQVEAREILQRINSHKVTGNTDKYDTDGKTGFCFGRAMAAHLEILGEKVANTSVRKIWLVGEMKNGGDVVWGHHVATMVKGTEGGWWVIDPYTNKIQTPRDWVSSVKASTKKSNPRVFVSEAQRWGAAWPSPYSQINLKDPVYNGYFQDYLADFRARRKIPTMERQPDSIKKKLKKTKPSKKEGVRAVSN